MDDGGVGDLDGGWEDLPNSGVNDLAFDDPPQGHHLHVPREPAQRPTSDSRSRPPSRQASLQPRPSREASLQPPFIGYQGSFQPPASREGSVRPHLPPGHEDSVEPSARSRQGSAIAPSYEPEDETSIAQQGHIAEEGLQVSRKRPYASSMAESSDYEAGQLPSKQRVLLVSSTPIRPQEAGSLGPSSGTRTQARGRGRGRGRGYQQRPRIVMTDATPIPGSHVAAVDLSEGSEITPVRRLRPQTLAKKRVK